MSGIHILFVRTPAFEKAIVDLFCRRYEYLSNVQHGTCSLLINLNHLFRRQGIRLVTSYETSEEDSRDMFYKISHLIVDENSKLGRAPDVKCIMERFFNMIYEKEMRILIPHSIITSFNSEYLS